jgi:hypothetical protein
MNTTLTGSPSFSLSMTYIHHVQTLVTTVILSGALSEHGLLENCSWLRLSFLETDECALDRNIESLTSTKMIFSYISVKSVLSLIRS